MELGPVNVKEPCRVRHERLAKRSGILVAERADGFPGVRGEGGQVDQRLDVGAVGRRAGDDRAAVGVADNDDRPFLGINHALGGGDILGKRGERVLRWR